MSVPLDEMIFVWEYRNDKKCASNVYITAFSPALELDLDPDRLFPDPIASPCPSA